MESQYFEEIVKALEEDASGWTPCVGCTTLVGNTDDLNLCLRCNDLDENIETITSEEKQIELQCLRTKLQKINTKHIRIHKGYPHGSAQAFSLALNYCHFAELEAKTDKQQLWKAKI